MGDGGRPARAGLRLSVREARPAVEDGAAAPVPRHPAGLVDRLGAPGGGGGVRAGGAGAGGADGRGAGRARRRATTRGVQHQPARRAPRWSRRRGRRHAVVRRGPAPRGSAPARHRRRPARPVSSADRVLDNGLVRVEFAEDGTLASVRDLAADREVLAGPGQSAAAAQRPAQLLGRLGHRQALPNRYTDLLDAESVTVVEDGPLLGAVRVERAFGKGSRIVQTVTVRAGSRRIDVETEIDWHEAEKILKAAFPLDVHAERSTAEIQFGHVHRPTHTNTSWEAARFEVSGAPLGACRRAGLRRRGDQRLDVRTRCHPHHPRRRRYDHHGPPQPGPRPARPGPRGRPGHAPLHLRAAAGRDGRGRDRARGTRSTCRCGWRTRPGASSRW